MNCFLKAFIPQHIGNKVILVVYGILRRFMNFISEKRILQNAVQNAKEFHSSSIYCVSDDFPSSVLQKIRYIENQSDWKNIRFGNGKKSTMSHSGCGIIAVYNALAALHERVSADVVVELIGTFERDGAVLGGWFGVAPSAIYDYFINNGYAAVMITEKSADILNSLGEKYNVLIVTAYNDERDITAMIHTICMTKAEDGTFVIHNGYYKNDDGRWSENYTGKCMLADAIPQIGKMSVAISVIGIGACTGTGGRKD